MLTPNSELELDSSGPISDPTSPFGTLAEPVRLAVWAVLAVATTGNVLGSVVNWLLGRGAAELSGRRWFPVSPMRLAQVSDWYRRWGYWSLLAAWVPLIGDPLTADWGFVNVNLRPYYAEGSKTVGYEIAEQLGWRLPQQVVAPIASGSLLTKIDKGFREFVALGLVDAFNDEVPGIGGGSDFLLARHGMFKRRHRFVATDKQRHDHVRENHDVAKRKHRVNGGFAGG